MELYIGIEGIGTRQCIAAMADQSGTLIATHRLALNISFHTTPRDRLQSILEELLLGVIERGGKKRDDLKHAKIFAGVSGVTFAYDAKVDLPNVFEGIPPLTAKNVRCAGDNEIIFYSHSSASDGSVINSGMGSRATFFRDGKSYHYGGWGPVLGDEGSGYHIGLQALRSMMQQFDLGTTPGTLWRHIARHLESPTQPLPVWQEAAIDWRQHLRQFLEHGLTDYRPALFGFSHSIVREQGMWDWRSVVSSLAIPVMSAWEAGDATAARIAGQAATALVLQHKNAWTLCGSQISAIHEIVLYGGIICQNRRFRELLVSKLHQRYQHLETTIKVRTPATPGSNRPVIGALLLALGGDHDDRLHLPEPRIVTAISERAATVEFRGDLAHDRVD